MQSFTTLTAKAAPLPLANIDTDMIIPKQFLTTIKRTGLSEGLFYEMRYDMDGKPVSDFVLNQPGYADAKILVAEDNFGCGSSREHAPWALLDYGFRCIIAPSFADIFYNNCFKNGILPVVLPKDQVESCMLLAKAGGELTVDLETQEVKGGNIGPFAFEVGDFRKHCLMNALDDIGLTLADADKIASFESGDKSQRGWLYKSA